MARIERMLCWAVAALIQPVCLFMMFTCAPKANTSPVYVVVAKAQLDALTQALEHYKADAGDYPSEKVGLRALIHDPGIPNWHGPYLVADDPLDPWNRPYQYQYRGRNLPEVVCLAGDGQPGGYRFNADISNLGSRRDQYRLEFTWRDMLSLLFTAALLGFFGYPFLPAVLRMVNRRFTRQSR